MSSTKRPAALLALALSACAACAEPAQPTRRVTYDLPFPGDAYPGQRPRLDVPAGGLGVVADSRSDTLSVVDLGAGKRLAAVPVGRDPVGRDAPSALAIDPEGGVIYVALAYPPLPDAGPHADHIGGTIFGYVQKLALDDLRLLGEVAINSRPESLALSADRRRLVAAHFNLERALLALPELDAARAVLTAIDTASLDEPFPSDPVRVPVCIAPVGLALSAPDGATAFVACHGEDALAIADLGAPEAEVKHVPVGPVIGPPGAPVYGPRAASPSPDGARIAVGCALSNEVRFFDVASAAFLDGEGFVTAGSPFFPAWSEGGERLYVPTQEPDELVLLDVANGSSEVTRRTFTGGECVRPRAAHARDAATVMLLCEGDGSDPGKLLVLDAGTLATVASAPVGLSPAAIAHLAGGGP